MTKTIYFYLLAILLTVISCAPLGTKFKKYQKSENLEIKTIGLVITNNIYNDQKFGKYVDSLFISHLKTEIKNVFKCEVLYIGQTDELLKNTDKYTSKESGFDAILECSINPYLMSTFSEPFRYNASVRTILLKTPEKNILAKSKFNTNFGKSYWRHPILEVAIKDGVFGALKPYSRLLKQK